jgi:hypothetical protein
MIFPLFFFSLSFFSLIAEKIRRWCKYEFFFGATLMDADQRSKKNLDPLSFLIYEFNFKSN